MKNKKGFSRQETLIIDLYDMDDEFVKLFRSRMVERHKGYNRYWSEFDPGGRGDYSKTFTQKALEEYWQDQVNTNDYKGTLDEFIKDYHLEMDVWFINCGYDFTGIKLIIIDAG